MYQNRLYLAVVTETNPDTTFDEIKDWFNNVRSQTIFDWTEIIVRFDVWHKAFGYMKQFDNVRFIHKTEPFWKDPDTLLVNEWDLSDRRKNSFNEDLLVKLWKK